MDCCKSRQCIGIEEVFDTKTAEDDLKRYKKKGPSKMTRLLLDQLRKHELKGASLMDVGGGVGIIQHELIGAEIGRVINVDASTAYSQFARREAEQRGYVDRAEYHIGDFVQIAPGLDPVDIVTLDRVICCYDDMTRLVVSSVNKAKWFFGVIYPIDRSLYRAAFGFANALLKLFKKNFNVFVHRNGAVEALIEADGFRRIYYKRGLFWQVALYEK